MGEDTYGLADVHPKSHPVKQPCQGIEFLLKPSRVCGCYHPIVSIEKFRLHCQPLVSLLRPSSAIVSVPDRPTCRLFPVSIIPASISPLPLLHHRFLVVNHCVHHHIENSGQQWVAMGDPSLSAEGCSVVPSCPRHRLQPHPIPLEEAKDPGPHAISLQNTQAPGPVQGAVIFVQVQEDCTED